MKYQRSASRGGFNPVRISRENVAKILQQGQRDAQLLKDVAESDLREGKRQIDGTNAAFNFEQEQDEKNIKIAQENATQQIRAAQDEAAVYAREAQNPSSLESAFKSLSELSSTAATFYQEYKTKQDEIIKQNDINKYFSDPEYKAKVDAAAQSMSARNSATTVEALSEINAADAVVTDKVPVAEIAGQVVKLSPGQQEAYIRGQAAQYPGYISRWFSDVNNSMVIGGQEYSALEISQDPNLYAQAIPQLRFGFLEQAGISNMSIEAQSNGLNGMVQVEGQLLAINGEEFVDRQKRTAEEFANKTFAEADTDYNLDEVRAAAQVRQIWLQLLYSKDQNFGKR